MSALSALRRSAARFLRDERGIVAFEIVIWLPLIIAIMGGTMALFEAFRQQSLNVKAAYTISDALSRETDPIDAAYLDGMLGVLRYMTDSDGDYGLRVSLVRYDADADRYSVQWSQSRGAFTTLQDDALQSARENLPQLIHNERVIVVETETGHVPLIPMPALQPQSFYTFAFTRPRFAPQLVWSDL